MILKRVEKDNVIKSIYSSSNVLASTYEKDKNDLIIIFNNGGQYKYSNVPNTDYLRFESADSQGVILNSHIKKYPFEKLVAVNVDAIILEITRLKDEEKTNALKAKQDALVGIMKNLVDGASITYTEAQLDVLTEGIKTYVTELNKK